MSKINISLYVSTYIYCQKKIVICTVTIVIGRTNTAHQVMFHTIFFVYSMSDDKKDQIGNIRN